MAALARLRVRPEISSLPPNSRDDPALAEAERLGIDTPFKLNNNESPWPPFPDAVAAIQAQLEELNWYPDPTYARLRQALAEHHRLDPARVVVGNGSHSLIRLLGLVLLTADDAALVRLMTRQRALREQRNAGLAGRRWPCYNCRGRPDALLSWALFLFSSDTERPTNGLAFARSTA